MTQCCFLPAPPLVPHQPVNPLQGSVASRIMPFTVIACFCPVSIAPRVPLRRETDHFGRETYDNRRTMIWQRHKFEPARDNSAANCSQVRCEWRRSNYLRRRRKQIHAATPFIFLFCGIPSNAMNYVKIISKEIVAENSAMNYRSKLNNVNRCSCESRHGVHCVSGTAFAFVFS